MIEARIYSMASPHDIEKQVVVIVRELLVESGQGFSQREISRSSSLQRHLGMDSLGRVELFRRIEKHFHAFPERIFVVRCIQ